MHIYEEDTARIASKCLARRLKNSVALPQVKALAGALWLCVHLSPVESLATPTFALTPLPCLARCSSACRRRTVSLLTTYH